MDAYSQLRNEAREIRDTAIKSARAEYQVAIRRIEALRRQLTGLAPEKSQRGDGVMTTRIVELLPRDGTFTILDVVNAMHADAVGSQFAANSIRSMFTRLLSAGTVQRVGRRGGHVLWAAQDAKVDACPFGGKTLADIAEQLIRERGPMRIAEMVVAMREAGYRPGEKPTNTSANVLRAITRFSGRFEKRNDGRWGLAEDG